MRSIKEMDKRLDEREQEIERLNKHNEELQKERDMYKGSFETMSENYFKLENIIKEVREYMKSIEHEPDADMYVELGQYKEYKHILDILDKENK